MHINRNRLLRHLRELAQIGGTPEGGVHRLAYSDEDREACGLVRQLLQAAGLQVRVDAAGNLIGRRAGSDPALPPILLGSHIDTVPNGGRFDGSLGSLAAVEVAHTLAEHDVTTRHPLEIVIFQNEEGGLWGSRAMVGEVSEADLETVSQSGKTIREGIRFLGGNPERLDQARRRAGEVAAYVEVHIEQGSVLEDEGTEIGVVEGIVGIGWWEVVWEGAANHAGTTPMGRRQDALLAAARFVDAVNRTVTRTPGAQVGTVGRLEVSPGAPNVIPGQVTLTLELRDLDAARIDALFGELQAEARAIGGATRTRVEFCPISRIAPAPADPRIRAAIATAATERGLSTRSMPCGAGHDAQSLARIAPAGMIFIPSIGGISHSPRELSRDQDVINGANVLLGTLLRLDGIQSFDV